MKFIQNLYNNEFPLFILLLVAVLMAVIILVYYCIENPPNSSTKLYIETIYKVNGKKEYYCCKQVFFFLPIRLHEQPYRKRREAEKHIEDLKEEINKREGNAVLKTKFDKV